MGIKTVILSTVIGGTLVASGTVAWLGGGSITDATDLIKDQDSQIEIFKANEGKLINQLKKTTKAIQDLQAEITAKNAQIAELIAAGGDNAQQIADLQAQIATLTNELNAKVAELEALQAQIAQGNLDLEEDANTVKAELERLVGELNEANADAERLAATVTEYANFSTSDTTSVDSAIADAEAAIGGQTVVITPPAEEEPEAPTYPEFNMISGTPIHLDGGKIKIAKDDSNFDGIYNLTVATTAASYQADVYLDGVKVKSINGDEVDLGTTPSLDGKILKIVTATETTEYKLINK